MVNFAEDEILQSLQITWNLVNVTVLFNLPISIEYISSKKLESTVLIKI